MEKRTVVAQKHLPYPYLQCQGAITTFTDRAEVFELPVRRTSLTSRPALCKHYFCTSLYDVLVKDTLGGLDNRVVGSLR